MCLSKCQMTLCGRGKSCEREAAVKNGMKMIRWAVRWRWREWKGAETQTMEKSAKGRGNGRFGRGAGNPLNIVGLDWAGFLLF